MQNQPVTPENYNFDPATGKPVEKPAEKLPEVHRRDYVFLTLLCLFALLAANSFYIGGLQLGFAVGAVGLLLCTLLYLRGVLHFTPLGILALAAACVTLISFAIYENTAFAFFKFLFLILSLSVFFVSACGIKAPSLDDFRALLSPFYLFFGESCPAIPMTARAVAGSRDGKVKKLGKILLSLCIAFPILAVLATLLIFADQAFESFVDSITIDFDEIFFTLFLGALLVLFGIPLVFAIRKSKTRLKTSEAKPYLSILDSTVVDTVLLSVALLYLVFLCTQVSYLVGGFAGLLPEDYTYAEYARRGFFEMCLVCLCNLGLLFFAELLVRRTEDGKLPLVTRIAMVSISGFSIFLVVASIAKMLLYIRSYGLTFLRLGTSIFMVFLLSVFTALIIKIFCKNFKHMRVILAAACIILSVTALAEPYQVIANYNLYAYESGMHDAYELDTSYLAYDCGSYGVPALIKLTKDANPDVAARAKERLENMHSRYYFEKEDLRATSLSSMKANKMLKEYYGE